MKNSRNIIGINIKCKRKSKNLSQQDLANLLGVDRQYVWRIENGKINFTIDYLDNIILKLDCNHTDFLAISDE